MKKTKLLLFDIALNSCRYLLSIEIQHKNALNQKLQLVKI